MHGATFLAIANNTNKYAGVRQFVDWSETAVIGVRDGGAGGGSCPPIRAVCRHEFGQRVDIIRAKHNTCLNNTNLGSVTAVNGEKTRI